MRGVHRDRHEEWPGPIAALTLFAEDLDAARRFYLEVFGLPIDYEDDNSAVFRFGDTLINLLEHRATRPARCARQGRRARLPARGPS